MTEVAPAATKRISMIATQSNKPANTPQWSMAARLPNDAIEQFEKQKEAERNAAKQKPKKRQYLFASTSDEDDDNDDDDDLEFDLARPIARNPSTSAMKENASDESVEEPTVVNHSKHDYRRHTYDKRPPMKKHKANEETAKVVQQPGKIAEQNVSVNVDRREVERLMRTHGANVKPKKNANSTETKTDKSNHPKTVRSAVRKNSDSTEDTSEVRKSTRMKKPVTKMSPSLDVREKGLNVDTSNKARTKRYTRKRAADDDDDEQPPPEIAVVSKTFQSNPKQIL